MRAEMADQRLPPGGQFGAQLAARQLGQGRRVGRAVDEGLEHGPPGDAKNVGRDRGQLDPRVLEQLVEPVDLTRPLLDEDFALAREPAPLADGAGGTKLPRSNPCSSTCASHTQSCTSVLRPGTCLRWAAFTSRHAKRSSRTVTGDTDRPRRTSPRLSGTRRGGVLRGEQRRRRGRPHRPAGWWIRIEPDGRENDRIARDRSAPPIPAAANHSERRPSPFRSTTSEPNSRPAGSVSSSRLGTLGFPTAARGGGNAGSSQHALFEWLDRKCDCPRRSRAPNGAARDRIGAWRGTPQGRRSSLAPHAPQVTKPCRAPPAVEWFQVAPGQPGRSQELPACQQDHSETGLQLPWRSVSAGS
jgi:hypothetical protein